MAAHAVFETHMLRNAVTAMKPPTIAPGRAPDQAQDESDASVETPALDGKPDDEAAHEEENHLRGVGRQDFVEGAQCLAAGRS